MRRKSSAAALAKALGIRKGPALSAVLKAQIIAAILREMERRELTHAVLASHSGLPRSAVTGILSGSLQRVTLDRILRLVDAAGLEVEIRIRQPASPTVTRHHNYRPLPLRQSVSSRDLLDAERGDR